MTKQRGMVSFVTIIVLAVLVAGGYALYQKYSPRLIGGDRDENGCLGSAGYSFDVEVGACVRSFDLTPDIADAASVAVDEVGRRYGLTVVSFDSYEDGSYKITLEYGRERTTEVVYVRDGQVVNSQ